MLTGFNAKTLMILMGLSTWLVVTPTYAAVFKIATVAPEGSQWMTEMRAAAAEIKERTDGRATVKYYGGGVMGNDKKVLRKIRIGQLQGGVFAASGLTERYPDIALYGLPLLFESQDEVDYVRPLFDSFLMEGLERQGLISFGFAGGGFAVLMGSAPATRIDDLRGQKIWVPEGDQISRVAMEAMNLSPVVLPISDVLTGLQTGLIEFVATPPVGALLLQWYTKVEFVMDFPVSYTGGLMAVDKRAFDRLSEADRAVFTEVMSRTYAALDQINRVDNEKAAAALKSNGLQFLQPDPADVASWRVQVRALDKEFWSQGEFTPELLPQLLDELDKYRSQQASATPAPSAAAR